MNKRRLCNVQRGQQDNLYRIEFNVTKINILIPILISTGAFLVEILSLYYFNENDFSVIDVEHIFNTTYIPTHIATTTGFLYQHFSFANRMNEQDIDKGMRGTVLHPQYTFWTVVSTCGLGFIYALANIRVTFFSQLVLLVLQLIYMIFLLKVEIKEQIFIYESPIRNVISNKKS